MRKAALVLSLLSGLALSSCAAGPHQLNRTVDDWDQKMYVNSPWLNALFWVVPVFPLAHLGAGLGDLFVTDAYVFWSNDAWDGKGTGFQHYEPTATDGQMRSLLLDDAHFLKVENMP